MEEGKKMDCNCIEMGNGLVDRSADPKGPIIAPAKHQQTQQTANVAVFHSRFSRFFLSAVFIASFLNSRRHGHIKYNS
jgi:hypothetical protein